jgi:hypothetical protein
VAPFLYTEREIMRCCAGGGVLMAMVAMVSAQVPNAGMNAAINPNDINSLLKAQINGEDTAVRAHRRHEGYKGYAMTTAVARNTHRPAFLPGHLWRINRFRASRPTSEIHAFASSQTVSIYVSCNEARSRCSCPWPVLVSTTCGMSQVMQWSCGVAAWSACTW